MHLAHSRNGRVRARSDHLDYGVLPYLYDGLWRKGDTSGAYQLLLAMDHGRRATESRRRGGLA